MVVGSTPTSARRRSPDDVDARALIRQWQQHNLRVEGSPPLQLFLKDTRASTPTVFDVSDAERDDPFTGIRCPLCRWRPSASSRWWCERVGPPEPVFEGCGTMWNTFATHGLCPGCGHQWHWTSCLRCGEWSLHEDWYEERGGA
jgi:hypothetical protein